MRQGFSRLLELQNQTAAAGAAMDTERGRFAALARDEAAPRAVAVPLLFQTPDALAARMAGLLELRPDAVVLEPSAGLGRLYRAARACHEGPMVLVELAADCCRELYEQTREDRRVTLRQGDFLSIDPGPVDAVIMNPPFRRGVDIRHIERAFSVLRPGGLLVGLCYNGPRQRAAFAERADIWEELPAGTFAEAGTQAAAVLLTLRKAP